MKVFQSLLLCMGTGLFLIGIPSLKCTTLSGYKMPVYPVNSCPRNETEWQKASRKLNCSEEGRTGYYHCVPNHDLSLLLEFCYGELSGRVEPGLCIILSQSSYLDRRSCSMFTNGCPDKSYIATMIYQFQACLEIMDSTGCYSADLSCRTSTQSSNTSGEDTSIYSSTTMDGVVMGVAITLGILIPVFSLGALILVCKKSWDWACRKRRNNGQKSTRYNVEGSKEHCQHHSSEERVDLINGESDINQFPVKESRRHSFEERPKSIPEESDINQFPMEESRRHSFEERPKSIPEETTKAYLRDHEDDTTYVPTLAVEVALKCLKKEHIIILTGKEGAGKTKLAFQVMHCLSKEGFKALKLENKEEWRKNVNISLRYVVLLDDLMSLANVSKSFDEEIKENVSKPFLDEILCCAQRGEIYVIIVCRRKQLEELKTLLPAHELFNAERCNCIIDISSSLKLTEDEKKQMLIQHAKKNNRKIENEYCEEILSTDTFFGFPYTCFLFFSRDDFFGQGPDFFRHTNKILFNRIDSLRKINASLESKISYTVLCYIFENGFLNISDHTCLSKILQRISEFLGASNINCSDLADVVMQMKGTYLIETKDMSNKYDFSHEAVREAVCISFGSLSPELVIKTCPWKTLNTVVKIASYQQKPQELVLKISEQYYEFLARRFLLAEFDEETIAKNIILSDACSDCDFVRVLLKCAIPVPTILRELWNLIITDKNAALLKNMLEMYGPHSAFFISSRNVAKRKKIRIDRLKKSKNFHINRLDIENMIEKCIIFRKEDKLLCIMKYVRKHQNLREIASFVYTVRGQNPMSLLQVCENNRWDSVTGELQAIAMGRRNVLTCCHLHCVK